MPKEKERRGEGEWGERETRSGSIGEGGGVRCVAGSESMENPRDKFRQVSLTSAPQGSEFILKWFREERLRPARRTEDRFTERVKGNIPACSLWERKLGVFAG